MESQENSSDPTSISLKKSTTLVRNIEKEELHSTDISLEIEDKQPVPNKVLPQTSKSSKEEMDIDVSKEESNAEDNEEIPSSLSMIFEDEKNDAALQEINQKKYETVKNITYDKTSVESSSSTTKDSHRRHRRRRHHKKGRSHKSKKRGSSSSSISAEMSASERAMRKKNSAIQVYIKQQHEKRQQIHAQSNRHQYDKSEIADALRGSKSIFITLDDDLISVKNEKHLIDCFQDDEVWSSDPHPLQNQRFLEVNFAYNLDWTIFMFYLLLVKELIWFIYFIIDEFEGVCYLLRAANIIIILYLIVFLRGCQKLYRKKQQETAQQQKSKDERFPWTTMVNSQQNYSARVRKITVESQLPFMRATQWLNVACCMLLFDSLAFLSEKASVDHFWLFLIPNMIFTFFELSISLKMVKQWIVIYIIFLPIICMIGLAIRDEEHIWWFAFLYASFIIVVAACSYITAKHKLHHKSDDLLLRQQLFVERREHKNIMLSLMPVTVAEIVLLKGETPLYNKTVTVGFIKMTFYDSNQEKIKDPTIMVPLLHKVILELDDEMETWSPIVTKIEHVQNCYLICGGILTSSDDVKHSEAAIRVAIAFQKRIENLNESFGTHGTCELTIGINTGEVIGTIIGTYRKYFRIFGDAVNTASRVCSTGLSGKITISESSFEHRDVRKLFEYNERPNVWMKGKGEQNTFIIHKLREFRLSSTQRKTVKRNKEWKKYQFLNGPDSNASGMLSMHFYQFLNTLESDASKFTLQFPNIHQLEYEKLHENDNEAEIVRHQSVQFKTLVSEFVMRNFSNILSQISTSEVEPNNGKSLRSESLENVFENDVTEYAMSIFWQLFTYVCCLLIISLVLNILAMQLQSLTVLSVFMILFHTLAFILLISSMILKIKNHPKFGTVYWYKFQKAIYCTMSLIFLMTSFRSNEEYSIHKSTVNAIAHLLAMIGLIIGFFSFTFKFYDIARVALLYVILHTVFEGVMQSASFAVIAFEYYVFLICVCIKYNTEKAWRFNIVYKSAIKKSRDERENSTSILIPKIMLTQVMKQSLQSNDKLLQRRFKTATIFQSDIVGFTSISSKLRASEVVSLLHHLYEYYDRFSQECECEKIETIGDAYICVNFSGFSEKVIDFAFKVLDVHQQMQNFEVQDLKMPKIKSLDEAILGTRKKPVIEVNVRCGIAFGEIQGCVLGKVGLRFHLFGNALDHAITLEGACDVGRILVCERTKEKCRNTFIKFEKHPEIEDAYFAKDVVRGTIDGLSKFFNDMML